MSSEQESPLEEAARAMAVGAAAAGRTDAPALPQNPWALQGWRAIEESHALAMPLARWIPGPVRPAATPADGVEDERGPGTVAIPETVLQPRTPQRLPEDAVCRSPIAGLVIAVMGAPGQEVKRHEPVLIIEAMKMENHVYPIVDGVLKAVHVVKGEAVKAGQVLFELC